MARVTKGKAWDCANCPQDTAICPAWAELVETHVRTGDERITKDCMFRLLPRMIVEVIKASNRPAAEVGQLRQEIFRGLTNAVRAIPPPRS